MCLSVVQSCSGQRRPPQAWRTRLAAEASLRVDAGFRRITRLQLTLRTTNRKHSGSLMLCRAPRGVLSSPHQRPCSASRCRWFQVDTVHRCTRGTAGCPCRTLLCSRGWGSSETAVHGNLQADAGTDGRTGGRTGGGFNRVLRSFRDVHRAADSPQTWHSRMVFLIRDISFT